LAGKRSGSLFPSDNVQISANVSRVSAETRSVRSIKRMVRAGQSDLPYESTADGTIEESDLTTRKWREKEQESRRLTLPARSDPLVRLSSLVA
jgi:hypothetical protein